MIHQHTAYIGEYLHFRYLKLLVNDDGVFFWSFGDDSERNKIGVASPNPKQIRCGYKAGIPFHTYLKA